MRRPATRLMCLYLPFLSTDQVRRLEDGGVLRPRTVLTQAVAAKIACLGQTLCRRSASRDVAGPGPRAPPEVTTRPHDSQRDQIVLRSSPIGRCSSAPGRSLPAIAVDRHYRLRPLFGGQERLATLALAGLAEAGLLCTRCGRRYSRQPSHWRLPHANRYIIPPGQTAQYLAPLPADSTAAGTPGRRPAGGGRTFNYRRSAEAATQALARAFWPELESAHQQLSAGLLKGIPVRLPHFVHMRGWNSSSRSEICWRCSAAADAFKDVFNQLQRQDEALRRLDVLLLSETPPQRWRSAWPGPLAAANTSGSYFCNAWKNATSLRASPGWC